MRARSATLSFSIRFRCQLHYVELMSRYFCSSAFKRHSFTIPTSAHVCVIDHALPVQRDPPTSMTHYREATLCNLLTMNYRRRTNNRATFIQIRGAYRAELLLIYRAAVECDLSGNEAHLEHINANKYRSTIISSARRIIRRDKLFRCFKNSGKTGKENAHGAIV